MRVMAMCVAVFLLAGAGAEAQAQAGAVVQQAEVQQLDLNVASTVELQALPGVGPALAMRIVEYRDRVGRFQRIEDLMNVRGIGEANFLRLRPLVKVTTPDASTPARR